MKHAADYVIAFDITSNKERTRVNKVLKNYGFRIQKSVYECKLRKKDKEKLISQLEKLKLKTGFIKIYKLEYQLKHVVIGEKVNKTLDDDTCFII